MTLDQLALKYKTDKASSHHDYCRIYEKYFDEYRAVNISMIEMGVQYGNSIKMWLEYFTNGTVFGCDIIKEFECNNPRYRFIQCSQTDLDPKLGDQRFDFIIDDAGHRADAMKAAFRSLWHRVIPGGIYFLEDVAVFWDDYFKSSVDGIGWLAELLGDLNHHGKDYHGKPNPIPFDLDTMEKSIDFINCYRGLVAIGKK